RHAAAGAPPQPAPREGRRARRAHDGLALVRATAPPPGLRYGGSDVRHNAPVTTVLHKRIADELGVAERQVQAAVELLDGGATVPFVARYRKEVTGSLDDAQLRTLEERLRYLRELEERRTAILDSVREQGKLTDELTARIMAADSKARLEDIY